MSRADQRYHQPGYGRFTSADPAGSGSNWYAYAGGDPINNSDPTGLFGLIINFPGLPDDGGGAFGGGAYGRPQHFVPNDDNWALANGEHPLATPVGPACSAGGSIFGGRGCGPTGAASNAAFNTWCASADPDAAALVGCGSGPISGHPTRPTAAPVFGQPDPSSVTLSFPYFTTGGASTSTGFGIGLLGGGSAEARVIAAGASLQGSVGAGVFVNGSGISGGVVANGAAVVYAGQQIGGAPTQTSSPTVFGAYAGYGPGIFITNAGCAQQLSGPFFTMTSNIGIGIGKASVSLGYSGGTWIFTASGGPQPISTGVGFSFSAVTTNTVATGTSACP